MVFLQILALGNTPCSLQILSAPHGRNPLEDRLLETTLV